MAFESYLVTVTETQAQIFNLEKNYTKIQDLVPSGKLLSFSAIIPMKVSSGMLKKNRYKYCPVSRFLQTPALPRRLYRIDFFFFEDAMVAREDNAAGWTRATYGRLCVE